jgi:hypothetical protein
MVMSEYTELEELGTIREYVELQGNLFREEFREEEIDEWEEETYQDDLCDCSDPECPCNGIKRGYM